jgi:hypothetical protein
VRKEPVSARFWRKVQKGTGCWLWMAGRDSWGYGVFWMGGRQCRANRVCFELTSGPIPEGKQVLHRCDNPQCVNPEHLFLGTNRDNVDDKVAKGRQPRGETNGRAKLSDEQAAEIGRRRRAGECATALAREFGVSQQRVSQLGGTS